MEASILIVDDDPQLGELLGARLAAEGFEVSRAHGGAEAIAMVRDQEPDLVLLDALMPEMDGWQACREIRRISAVPIIFLSCTAEDKDKVRGLDLGADDYVGKPFSGIELVARIRAVLRRREANGRRLVDSPYVDGELVIDLAGGEARSDRGAVVLTLTERRILACLIRQGGKVVPRQRLLSLVSKDTGPLSDDSLRQHIHHLREKLEADPLHPRRIMTRRGQGYQLRRLSQQEGHL